MVHRHLSILAAAGLVFAAAATSPRPMSAQDADPGKRAVALVTGSTDGLGREVAYRLGLAGYHVIVHGRNAERGQEVVDSIIAREGSADLILADLGSMEEVRGLAAQVQADYDRLDLLVNNAGIGRGADVNARSESQDGYELRFAVNYLSHFYLTYTLLPMIRESAPARIVNVSSAAQQAFDFDNVMLEEEYVGTRAYAQSKLGQIMMTIDLAEELEGTGVTINAVHPAVYMATSMVLDRGGTPFATIDEGADPVMQLVTSPTAGSGHYYSQDRIEDPEAQALDPDARRQLRELARELAGMN